MSNFIIAAILAVVLFFCLRSSLRHFRGEGGCCGSGCSYKAKPKKLASVTETKTFTIEGMSCQNCVNRVMDAVNSIDGVSADVKLKKELALVSKEYEVSDEVIKSAIERAGYKVTGIR